QQAGGLAVGDHGVLIVADVDDPGTAADGQAGERHHVARVELGLRGRGAGAGEDGADGAADDADEAARHRGDTTSMYAETHRHRRDPPPPAPVSPVTHADRPAVILSRPNASFM